MRINRKQFWFWFLLPAVSVLALALPEAALWAAVVALMAAGVFTMFALAVIGALFCVVVAVTYRERVRAANARPPWLPEIEPLPETVPEPVERLSARNGKL